MQSISVIIPAKNEALNICQITERVALNLPISQILVIDAGTDNTHELVSGLKSKLPNIEYHLNDPDLGKGSAIRKGIELATGDIIVQIDADLQFMPEEIHKLVEPIQNKSADMTIGSRFMSESSNLDNKTSFKRTFGNYLVSFLLSLLYSVKISDALTGLKAWRKDVTHSFILESNKFSYEIELIAKAVRLNWKVVSIPITTTSRELGNSKVSVFKNGLEIIRDLFIFRFCKIKS